MQLQQKQEVIGISISPILKYKILRLREGN